MKKLNESVLRKLIIETIEADLPLTEGRKKKKIKEVDDSPLGDDELAAASRGARTIDPNPEDYQIKPNLDPNVTKQLIESYESTIPLFIDSLKKAPNSVTAGVVASNLKEYAKKFEELSKSAASGQQVVPGTTELPKM